MSYKTYIGNITWARKDMEFIFQCSTQYLTSEPSSLLRCLVDYEKSDSITFQASMYYVDYVDILQTRIIQSGQTANDGSC
mgnify:CR=1 FL=1